MATVFVNRPARPVGIADDFDRANGTSVVAYRSDGGTWTLPGSSTWEIQNNRLVATTSGGGGVISADYGEIDDLTITAVVVASDPYGAFKIRWAVSGSEFFELEFKQFERLFILSDESTTYWSSTFTVPDWENLSPHTCVITYDRTSGACTVTFDGTQHYSGTVDTKTGTGFSLNSDEWVLPDSSNLNGYNSVTVAPT